jgi:hypothetical protein
MLFLQPLLLIHLTYFPVAHTDVTEVVLTSELQKDNCYNSAAHCPAMVSSEVAEILAAVGILSV